MERIKTSIQHKMNRPFSDQDAKKFIEENVTFEYTERDLLTNKRSYAVSVKSNVTLKETQREYISVGQLLFSQSHLRSYRPPSFFGILVRLIPFVRANFVRIFVSMVTGVLLGVVGYIIGGEVGAAVCFSIGVVTVFMAYYEIKEFLVGILVKQILMQLGEVTNTGADRMRITIQRQ